MKTNALLSSLLSAFFALSCSAAPITADQPVSVEAKLEAVQAEATPVAVKPAAVKKPSVTGAQVLKAAEGAVLSVSGDSTLHKWKANATELSIEAELAKAGDPLAVVKAQGLTRLELVAATAALKSEKGKSMDKNMHKTLEVKEFPEIRFSLSSYELKGSDVAAKGSLSIHGQSRDVVLPGTVTAKDNGLNVKGSYDLKMSDYGIKPPVMMLGTMRVADALTISYDFTLVP